MLDLNPRVHLDEVVVPFFIDKKFNRTGIAVLDLSGDLERGSAELFTLRLGQTERRGKLDNLLMTALYRAVAIEEVDEIAVIVPHHLYFDMLGIFDVPF